jgi:hypothetical protein
VRKTLVFLLLLLTAGWRSAENSNDLLLSYCSQFRELYENIANASISPDSASRAFTHIMQGVKSIAFYQDSCQFDTIQAVFPVKGYRPVVSIGGQGRGYKPDGFDLFDVEVKGSHPAHDLFILDRNRDSRDDRTKEPVDILSFSSGIILDVQNDWQPESGRRGGNYVWIYDPCRNGLFYYAHFNSVVVEQGSWINPGDKLGEVGRTGLNATRKRSDTHLHLMFLRMNTQGLPVPENTFEQLMSSRVTAK